MYAHVAMVTSLGNVQLSCSSRSVLQAAQTQTWQMPSGWGEARVSCWQLVETSCLGWVGPLKQQANGWGSKLWHVKDGGLFCHQNQNAKILAIFRLYWNPITLVLIWKVLRQAFRWCQYFWNPSTFGRVISLFDIFSKYLQSLEG
jgi:hypothetical protein